MCLYRGFFWGVVDFCFVGTIFWGEISHFPLICQQWHFEDLDLIADPVIRVMLKHTAWEKCELPKMPNHPGVKTRARVGWGGSEHRPAQKS